MDRASSRLQAGRLALEGGFATEAVSLAYYAMLYAVRAALSEEDRYAKTHSGTWTLFRETFVATERFDSALAAAASDVQRLRELGDYEATNIPAEKASEVIELADRFLRTIAARFGD
jgi:uncharacterized protein (UPF0332 family)